MVVQTILHHLMTTRYARELESEVARLRDDVKREHGENSRLRAENRALLNSILGIAGIPPVIVAEDAPELAPGNEPAGESASQPHAPGEKGKGSLPDKAGLPAAAGAIAPLRRRSWHQVMRGLEIAAARKPQEKGMP